MRRSTTVTPMSGIMSASSTPTINARCMNAYSNISMTASCVGVVMRQLVKNFVRGERVNRAVLQTENAGHVVRHSTDVVGDEQDGDAGLAVQPVQQLADEAAFCASRRVIGSSRTSSEGLFTSARASRMRCR